MMSAITKIMISSGMPMEPNMGLLQCEAETAGNPALTSNFEYTALATVKSFAGWGVIG